MVKGRRPSGRRLTSVTELNVASLNLSVTYQVDLAEMIAWSSSLARTVRPFPLVGTTFFVHKANPGHSWCGCVMIQPKHRRIIAFWAKPVL